MKVIQDISNVDYDRLLAHSNEFLARHRFYKRGDKLYYRMPPYANHRSHWVIVVAPRDRYAVLLQFFNNLWTRVGRDSFFTKVREKYANITREQAFEFLQKQPEYQLHLIQPRERVLRPNNATGINQKWQIDHIDMSKFHSNRVQNYKWIFVVIDTFSKYVWAKAYLHKDADSVRDGLKLFLKDNKRITGGRPKVIQSDNALEYKSQTVRNFLIHKGIKQMFIPTYMPQANGIVERVNRTIKNAIFTNFTQNNNTRYNDLIGDFGETRRIDKIVEEYNNSYHTTIKNTPANVHKRNRVNSAQLKLVDKRLEEWGKNWHNYPELRVGDKVRLHILTNSQERKKAKSGFTKKYIPQWSEEIFEVSKIIGANSSNVRPKYKVIDEDDEELEKAYYRHDLQKIDPSDLPLN